MLNIRYSMPDAGSWRTWLVVSACVFAASLAVLWWNAAPSVTFHDSGEFACAAATGGIPHPPGAPTWTILATLFVKLGGFHDPARGTNLLSGLLGAFTLALLCSLVQLWVYILYPGSPKWLPPASGVVTSLILLHTSAFLEQSFITEQYTLQAALLVGILLTCTAIGLRAKAGRHSANLSVLLGLLWGLAIGNHLSQIVLGFLVIWALWAASNTESRLPSFLRLGWRCGVGLVAGLMVFLWLPIRSRANPIIDWGNVETLPRFIWAITRRQWETHPMSEAPKNLVMDWVASYDPVTQIGVIGLILLAVGMLILVRRQRTWLGWLAAVTIPYSAGLLLAHMRQKTVSVDFIQSYGVLDWHLPEYIAMAIGAGIGFAWAGARLSALKTRILPLVWLGAIALPLGLTTARVIGEQSLRGYSAPDEFVRDILTPLPPDAAITAAQDGIGFMMTYRKWITEPNARYWVTIRAALPWRVMEDPRAARATPAERRMELILRAMDNPDVQPYRVPLPPMSATRAPRVFCDFLPTHPEDIPYLLPAGYIFEFPGYKVSNAEARAAERAWRAKYPDLFREPPPNPHRLTREAYGVLHMERGVYFARREMWPEAEDAYERALQWQPDNGSYWFYYADVLEHEGKLDQAVEAYKRSIVRVPMYTGPIYNLAMLYARTGHYEEAEQLLATAARIDPKDARTRASLSRVRGILGVSGGRP